MAYLGTVLLNTTAGPDLGGLVLLVMGVGIVLVPLQSMLWFDRRMGPLLLRVLGQKGTAIFYKLLGIGLIVLGVSLLV